MDKFLNRLNRLKNKDFAMSPIDYYNPSSGGDEALAGIALGSVALTAITLGAVGFMGMRYQRYNKRILASDDFAQEEAEKLVRKYPTPSKLGDRLSAIINFPAFRKLDGADLIRSIDSDAIRKLRQIPKDDKDAYVATVKDVLVKCAERSQDLVLKAQDSRANQAGNIAAAGLIGAGLAARNFSKVETYNNFAHVSGVEKKDTRDKPGWGTGVMTGGTLAAGLVANPLLFNKTTIDGIPKDKITDLGNGVTIKSSVDHDPKIFEARNEGVDHALNDIVIPSVKRAGIIAGVCLAGLGLVGLYNMYRKHKDRKGFIKEVLKKYPTKDSMLSRLNSIKSNLDPKSKNYSKFEKFLEKLNECQTTDEYVDLVKSRLFYKLDFD